jgi:hypothetical protein
MSSSSSRQSNKRQAEEFAVPNEAVRTLPSPSRPPPSWEMVEYMERAHDDAKNDWLSQRRQQDATIDALNERIRLLEAQNNGLQQQLVNARTIINTKKNVADYVLEQIDKLQKNRWEKLVQDFKSSMSNTDQFFKQVSSSSK